jgi:hypothetical protein
MPIDAIADVRSGRRERHSTGIAEPPDRPMTPRDLSNANHGGTDNAPTSPTPSFQKN